VAEVSGLISTISNSSGISTGGTGDGTKTSLNSKLQAALNYYLAGDVATACSKLQDFINEVNAQTGKKISPDVADSLISSAAQILTDTGCAQLASNSSYANGELSAFDRSDIFVWSLINAMAHLLL